MFVFSPFPVILWVAHKPRIPPLRRLDEGVAQPASAFGIGVFGLAGQVFDRVKPVADQPPEDPVF